jgi:hypothetical protein
LTFWGCGVYNKESSGGFLRFRLRLYELLSSYAKTDHDATFIRMKEDAMQTTTNSQSQTEMRRPMLGDNLIPDPMGMRTNGVTIKATPEHIWPWIVQIGAGRAGWYAYDWIDNGGRPSSKSIMPEHQQLATGDIVPAIPGMTDAFCVAMVEPPLHLILTVPDGKGVIQVSYEFLLVPLDYDHTRLVMRGRISQSWPTSTKASPALSQPPTFIELVYGVLERLPRPLKLGVAFLGHHMMESKMLRGIKQRAQA